LAAKAEVQVVQETLQALQRLAVQAAQAVSPAAVAAQVGVVKTSLAGETAVQAVQVRYTWRHGDELRNH
jgi:myo-inositol catabolism protein IolC